MDWDLNKMSDTGFRCEPVRLSDGTVVLASSCGSLLPEDIQAMEAFNEFLKCQVCTDRHGCALNACVAKPALADDN